MSGIVHQRMNVLLLTQNLVGTGFNRFAAAEITGVDGTVGAFFLYALLDFAQLFFPASNKTQSGAATGHQNGCLGANAAGGTG